MNELEFLKEGLNLMLQTDKVDAAIKSKNTSAAMTAILVAIVAVSEKITHQAKFVDGSVSASGDVANATIAANSQLKVGVQKEIPFRGEASKGKEANLAASGKSTVVESAKTDVISDDKIKQPESTTEVAAADKSAEVKGEDTAVASTDTMNSSAEVAASTTETPAVGDTKEVVVDAETEIGKTAEETEVMTTEVVDKHAKDRMTTEKAIEFVKDMMTDLFMGPNKDGKGKRNNDRPTRKDVNDLIMNTFPVTEEESKETKEGNIKRNKLQDQLWREITSEMKEKLTKKEEKVTTEASKAADSIISEAKALLETEKPVDEPVKVPASADLDKTKVVTAEEIQTAAATEEPKTAEVVAETTVAEDAVDDLVAIANAAAAEEVAEEPKVVTLPEVNLSKCPIGEFFQTMKDSLSETSAEDLDNNADLLKKWVDLLNTGASMPDRANLIGAKASVIIKSIFGVIKKENLKKKAA